MRHTQPLFGEPQPTERQQELNPASPPLQRPEPSWRVLNAEDPLSRSAVAINRQHVELATACTPSLEDCVDDVLSRLSVRLGIAESRAMTLVTIGFMLRNFPGIASMAAQGHLSLEHLNILGKDLECVPEMHRDGIEKDLLARLAPTRPNQCVWSVRKLHKVTQEVVAFHHPPAHPRDDDPPPPPPAPDVQQPELSWNTSKAEVSDFFLRLNKADSAELIQILEYVARKEKTNHGEALLVLVRGQTTAEVTLNIYRPVTSGVGEAPEGSVWVAGQWLPPMVSAQWLDRVTHLAAPGWDRCEGYHPTDGIRASVMGRDGHCRFPGCDVPAERCDLDHVHRWDHDADHGGGSETSTDNLHCLCRRHHRLKTAGQWDVTLHRDGTETWTSHGDGHTVVTQPGGVLGRETFEHRAVRRTKNLAAHNDDVPRREAWAKTVAAAARMAYQFGTKVDETSSPGTVEAFAQMYAQFRSEEGLVIGSAITEDNAVEWAA